MAEHAHTTPTSTTPPSHRRTLFAAAGAVIMGSGITAGAAASVADFVEPPAGTEPSLIIATAIQIKTIVDRENFLDAKGSANLSPAEEAEEIRLYDTRMALAEQITLAAPASGTEALIVIMHAVDRMNFGNPINDGGEILDVCERAVRRACVVLAREMQVNLVPFGSENFLPVYLSEHPAGRV